MGRNASPRPPKAAHAKLRTGTADIDGCRAGALVADTATRCARFAGADRRGYSHNQHPTLARRASCHDEGGLSGDLLKRQIEPVVGRGRSTFGVGPWRNQAARLARATRSGTG